MKRWIKRIVLGGVIAVLAAVVLFGGAVLYTNRSDFCTTCHYMQPFYDAWASSSHHMVPCRDCHYEPGYTSVVTGKFRDLNQLVKYWTNAYRRSKPWAEIADASCLRSGCHETRLLHGRVTFDGVNFDHKPHLEQMRRGKKLRCVSCHAQIVQGEHMTVTENTCILCHFKTDEQGRNVAHCTICHNPPVPVEGSEPPKYDHTSVIERKLDCVRCHGAMVVGDGAVPRERCYACHWDRERLDQFGNTDLVHRMHITENKIECDLCHLSMQHKSVAREQAMPDCQACHTDLHTAQKDLFSGHGGVGVADQPNPMFEKGLTCQGCHIFHTANGNDSLTGGTFIASGKSCEPCHGAGYDRLLADWKKSAEQRMETIRRALEKAAPLQASAPTGADSLLRQAQYNYDMVRLGRPIHNIVYANALLDAAYQRLGDFFAQVGAVYRLPALPAKDRLVPSACVNCHSGIEEIDAPIFGLVYSHKRHLINARLTCSRCHSNARRHGELTVQRSDCLGCHHAQTERDCTYCHTIQATILTGKSDSLPLENADPMIAAGISCGECHRQPDNTIAKPASQRCADCHDESYPALHRQWLSEFATAHQAVSALLAKADSLPVTPERDRVLEPIRLHLRTIEADGSRGSHNHTEQIRILETDKATLERIINTRG
ncbi:MAG: cytochrome c3 family protein [Candidatus Zixiibacteriota bacterium]